MKTPLVMACVGIVLFSGCKQNDSMESKLVVDPLEMDQDGDGFIARVDCSDQDPLVSSKNKFFRDSDGDGRGDISAEALFCAVAVAGYSAESSDCDDSNPQIWDASEFFVDSDQDGFGGLTTSKVCKLLPPLGFSLSSDDPDDSNAAITAMDRDGDRVADAVDCAPSDPSGSYLVRYYEDEDHDQKGNPMVSQDYCVLEPAPEKPNLSLNNLDSCPTVANWNLDADLDAIDDACDADINATSLLITNRSVVLDHKVDGLNRPVSYSFGALRVEDGGSLHVNVPVEIRDSLTVELKSWVDPATIEVKRPKLKLGPDAVIQAKEGPVVNLSITAGEISTVDLTPNKRASIRNFWKMTIGHTILTNPRDNRQSSFYSRTRLEKIDLLNFKDAQGALQLVYHPVEAGDYSFSELRIAGARSFPIFVDVTGSGWYQADVDKTSVFLSSLLSAITYENNGKDGPRLSINHYSSGRLIIQGPNAFTGGTPTGRIYIENFSSSGNGPAVKFHSLALVARARDPEYWRVGYFMFNIKGPVEFDSVSRIEAMGFWNYDNYGYGSLTLTNSKGYGLLTSGISFSLIGSELHYQAGDKVMQAKRYTQLNEDHYLKFAVLNSKMKIVESRVYYPTTLNSFIINETAPNSSGCGPAPASGWNFYDSRLCIDYASTVGLFPESNSIFYSVLGYFRQEYDHYFIDPLGTLD